MKNYQQMIEILGIEEANKLMWYCPAFAVRKDVNGNTVYIQEVRAGIFHVAYQ